MSRPDGQVTDAPATWLSRGERGTRLGIRVVFWLANLVGRRITQQVARLLALYYATFDRQVRHASRRWLTRVHGGSPSWWHIYQHVLRFARVSIDRIFLLQGATHYFDVARTGNHYLKQLVAS